MKYIIRWRELYAIDVEADSPEEAKRLFETGELDIHDAECTDSKFLEVEKES